MTADDETAEVLRQFLAMRQRAIDEYPIRKEEPQREPKWLSDGT